MRFEYLARKRRQAKAKVYFSKDSFCVNDYKVAPVHHIPRELRPNQELDFYIKTKYDVYLLRLINKEGRAGSIYPAPKEGIIIIVSELPFDYNTVIEVIDKVLMVLRRKPFGFPKLKNPKDSLNFQLEDKPSPKDRVKGF